MSVTAHARAEQGFPDHGEPCFRLSAPFGFGAAIPTPRGEMKEVVPPRLRLVTTHVGQAGESTLRDQIEAARGGDPGAFRELFECYSPSLFRYAVSRLGDHGLAEDAAQNVFMVAWTKLGEFRYEHDGSFVAWLFAIARRVVKGRGGRERLLASVPLDGADRAVDGFEETVLDRASLSEGLLKLPDLQREVVVLRFLVGLSLPEVALTVGKSESRVKELQLRGLARLRAHQAGGNPG
jgi:RNA polymerase sigma-70 factor (ECF subfamily)